MHPAIALMLIAVIGCIYWLCRVYMADGGVWRNEMAEWPCDSELKTLSRLLSLPIRGDEEDWELQDWEWDFADPARVREFLEIYEHACLSDNQKLALMSLVVESYDQRVGIGEHDPLLWERIESHLVADPRLHAYTINHWRISPEFDRDPPVFDVGARIRQLFGSPVAGREPQ